MSRTAAFLLGPELAWLIMLALTGVLIVVSRPLPTDNHDTFLNAGWFLPAIGILLAFVSYYWLPSSSWWWLLRVLLASLVGVCLVAGFLCEAARYNDSRDSGIGTSFIVFVSLDYLLLFSLVLIAALCFQCKPFTDCP